MGSGRHPADRRTELAADGDRASTGREQYAVPALLGAPAATGELRWPQVHNLVVILASVVTTGT